MARHFAVGDSITLDAGGAAGATRAHTIVALIQPTLGNGGVVQGLASGTPVWSLLFDALKLFANGDFGTGGSTITSGAWYVVAVTKAGGSNVYRYHSAPLSTGIWTHVSSSFSVADGGGGTDAIRLGTAENNGNVDIAALAEYAGALSDGAIEALGITAMADWLAASPRMAVQLNQASTADPVTDLTGGGADQTAISGTSVVSDPPGWSYFSGAPNQGVLTATLPALVAALAGDARVAAQLAGTLPPLAGSMAGAARVSGVLAGVLPALVGSLVEVPPVTGALSMRSTVEAAVSMRTAVAQRVRMEVDARA